MKQNKENELQGNRLIHNEYGKRTRKAKKAKLAC
jgi:hypothetical protein